MPSAFLRPCPSPGCPELVTAGRCQTHTKQADAYRGTSSARGYDATWRTFRQYFIRQLIDKHIYPICGARLSGIPSPYSQCAAQGLVVDRSADGTDLHVDHDPPLTDAERQNSRAVCDLHRVGLLCKSCHNRKTQGEQQR